MKLRPFVITLLCGAALAANAGASVQLQTVARDGVTTTSRSASKDCGFTNDYFGFGDLLLICDGRRGSAQARYDFSLPQNLYGKPSMNVYANKLCCSGSHIQTRLVRISKRHYRIVVSASEPTRFDVRSVSLSYYTKT